MQDIYSIQSSAITLELEPNNKSPQIRMCIPLSTIGTKNCDGKHSLFCLPLFFMLSKVEIVINDRSEVEDCVVVENQSKYEGVLTYENGRPVCFKQSMFIMRQKQKKLAPCYQIDRCSYFLKFTHTQPLNNPPHHQNITPQQLNNRALQQIVTKLEQNKENLFIFLVEIGLISVQDKSLNRFSSILKVRQAKKKMQQILQLHALPYLPQQKNKQNQTDKKQFIRSSISTEGNQSQKEYPPYMYLNFTENNIKRTCCRKQYLKEKSDYPEVLSLHNPITRVKNIEVTGVQAEEEAYGGYFNVKSCDAVLEVENQQTEEEVSNHQNFQMDIEEKKDQEQGSKDDNQEMSQQNKAQKITTQLAIKILKDELQDSEKYVKKVEHEMSIIRQIRYNPYICRYYESENQLIIPTQSSSQISEQVEQKQQETPKTTPIIMQKLLISLKQLLARNVFSNKFLIIKQLTKSIILLHQSGIIHRDIKPGNIMFNESGQLKLIDFSESIECWRKYSDKNKEENEKIGFTLPYCPVQCSRSCEQGFANMKIDNWSVGMTVSQIIFGSLPVCYSRSLKNSIKQRWSASQFHWCMDLRTYNLNSQLLLPIKILCLKLMQADWRDRLCLQSFESFLQFYQNQLTF